MKTAEKPDFRENQYWEGVHFGEFSRKFKSGKFKRDEDAWLEKLRSSFDESIADCHHSLELVAAKLGEYTEKAEKLEVVRKNLIALRELWETGQQNKVSMQRIVDDLLNFLEAEDR